MAVGNLVKRLQDIMRKDAGINGDAQRIEYTAEPSLLENLEISNTLCKFAVE